MGRDESTASSIINLAASVLAQGSTLAGAACASAFDSEVPAGARGRTSGAVADEQAEWLATLGVEVAGEGSEFILDLVKFFPHCGTSQGCHTQINSKWGKKKK